MKDWHELAIGDKYGTYKLPMGAENYDEKGEIIATISY